MVFVGSIERHGRSLKEIEFAHLGGTLFSDWSGDRGKNLLNGGRFLGTSLDAVQ
jgi:hypothetical protein